MGDARFNQSPRTTLTGLRALWALSLLGQIAFAAIVVALIVSERVAIGGEALYTPMTFAVGGALAVLTPLGYFIRNQCYKARWEGHVVAPAGYFNGNVILLAMLEAVATAAIVTMLVTGRLLVPGVIALVAAGVQVINFPTGAPMRPHRPRLTHADRHEHAPR